MVLEEWDTQEIGLTEPKFVKCRVHECVQEV